MSASAADEESSPAPAGNEGGVPTAAVAAGVGVADQAVVGGKEMDVGAAAAVEEADEAEEPEEAAGAEEEEEEPEEATASGVEADEDAEEDPEEDSEDPEEEGEENAGEESEEGADEETTMMEPLAVVKPGEVQEEKDRSKDPEDEADEESEEEAEESDEVNKGADKSDRVAEDGAKGSMDGSAADDMNEISPGAQCGGKCKDKVADHLGNSNDSGGSRNGDVQNFELAGGLEILVDELPKDCVEEDVAMVFSVCGEIKSIRIIKNPSTEKSKDIAFVCYASIEAANKALTEFKEGIEVKGIKVRVSACQDNKTVYMGNICKSWTKDQVLTALNSIGIQECKINLPSNYKGRNRGFAFLKFASHYFARAAFRRLMKPDAIFGTDRSVKVSFYRTPTKPCDDFVEAKRIYLEHVPLSWNEDKIKECCEGYGKILNVDVFQISKNLNSETFSFVEFSSSKSALACVEGINNAKIVDGGFKLSACLARPKNGATSEGATTSKKEKDHKEKVSIDKNSSHKLPKGNESKLTSRTKEVVVSKNTPSKLPKDRKLTSQDAAEVLQSSKSPEGKRKQGKNKNASVNQRPSKKARNNGNVDESNLTYQGTAALQANLSKGKKKAGKNKHTYINDRPLKKAHNDRNVLARRPNRIKGTGQPAGPQYGAYHSAGGSSRYKTYASDLEPHAGYIPPAVQVHSTHAYDQRRTAHYDIRPIDVHPYARETIPSRSTYSGYPSRAEYQTEHEYIYPPPRTSGSYYPGSGSFIARRGDY